MLQFNYLYFYKTKNNKKMLDWFKIFDRETFMLDFGTLEFRKFNPFYKIEQQNEDALRGQDSIEPRVESIFDSSNSFSQMFYQFNLLLKEQIKIKQNQDPFAETCMAYCRQSCLLLTNQLMQAHLLVSENKQLSQSSSLQFMRGTDLSSTQELEQFKQHCMHLVHWGQAEQFYIFTTCNLVQTNDTTKFYRERVLMIGLRILYAQIYLLRNVIQGSSETLGPNIEPIKGRFKYKQDLTEILLTKIRHYGLVGPLEFLTFQAIYKLECNFLVTDKVIFDLELFTEKFKKSFFRLLKELREEPVNLIKEELKLNRLDLDGILTNATQYSHSPMTATPTGGAAVGSGDEIRHQISIRNVDVESHRGGGGTRESDFRSHLSPEEAVVTHRKTQKDDDEMSAKSFRSTRASGKKNINGMKLLKSNVLKTKQEIDEAVENDQAIDLEKIRKTFKNLINDQRFLQNYEKIKSGNPQLLNAKDRQNFEKRQQQVAHARNIFVTQVQKKPQFYLQKVLENLRQQLDDSAAQEKSMHAQNDQNDVASDDDDQQKTHARKSEHKSTQRKKGGDKKGKAYYNDGEPFDSGSLPLDLVDHYLKDKYDITLNQQTNQDYRTTAIFSMRGKSGHNQDKVEIENHQSKKLGQNNHTRTNQNFDLKSGFNKFSKSSKRSLSPIFKGQNRRTQNQQHGPSDEIRCEQASTQLVEGRAHILENPVYKKMPFYPYKDLLMWQEIEAQQCRDYSQKLNELIYREVRNTYLQQVKEEVAKQLKQNPQINMDTLDATNATKMMAQLYGESAAMDKLLFDLHTRDGTEWPTVRHKIFSYQNQGAAAGNESSAIQSSADKGGGVATSDDENNKVDPALEIAAFRRLADQLSQKFIQEAEIRKNDESKRLEESSYSMGGGMDASQSNNGQWTRPAANSLNSMKQSGVFSDQDTRFAESRLIEDDQIDQSVRSLNLSTENETQPVINSNMQGAAPTQTQAFVEGVATQFEKLFKNLDQISDLKMSDGVTKRNKVNPAKVVASGSQGAAGGQRGAQQAYQGVFGEAVGLSDNEQRDLFTDRRPIRIRDVSPDKYQ